MCATHPPQGAAVESAHEQRHNLEHCRHDPDVVGKRKISQRNANIDCRYNYINHFDVYADLVGIYKSNIYYAQQGSEEIAGTITATWNDTKTETETDIIEQNNQYANILASVERAWKGGEQYIEQGRNNPAQQRRGIRRVRRLRATIHSSTRHTRSRKLLYHTSSRATCAGASPNRSPTEATPRSHCRPNGAATTYCRSRSHTTAQPTAHPSPPAPASICATSGTR